MHNPVKLIVAHGHPVLRGILNNILLSVQGVDVIGEASTADSLLETATAMQPCIIVADISLVAAEQFAVLDKLVACCKDVKVIISWRYRDEAYLKAAMDAKCAGYISHDASPGEYSVAIKDAMKGKVFYCRQTEKLKTLSDNMQDTGALFTEILSEGYYMMIFCRWLGFSNKETAVATGLSKETIDTYRKKFNNAIGSRSVAALVSFMRKNGMV